MKKKIIKNHLVNDIITWLTIMLISIAIIIAGAFLEKKVLIILFGIILLIYSVLFALAIVKYIICYPELSKETTLDFIGNREELQKKLNEKKDKRIILYKKIFKIALIIAVFLSGISILCGVWMDKMGLVLVFPGWICSVLLLYFIVISIDKAIDYPNHFSYLLSKNFARFGENSLYYRGHIYYLNIFGFTYKEDKIFFLKWKIADIDLVSMRKVDPKLEYVVSSCLAGISCKYNGEANLVEEIKALVDEGKAIPVCPEVLGGLPIPRVPAEIIDGKVINQENLDVSENYERGAHLALYIAIENNIQKAILKSKSPSCGSGEIYDGTFQHKVIPGDGFFAKLCKENGITVYTNESFIGEETNVKNS